jgi:hypothetical protein
MGFFFASFVRKPLCALYARCVCVCVCVRVCACVCVCSAQMAARDRLITDLFAVLKEHRLEGIVSRVAVRRVWWL